MHGASESSRSSVLPMTGIVLLTRRIYGADRICFHAKRLETFFFSRIHSGWHQGREAALKSLLLYPGIVEEISATRPCIRHRSFSASDSIIKVQTSSDLTSTIRVRAPWPRTSIYTSPSTSSKSAQGDAPRIGHGWLRIRK